MQDLNLSQRNVSSLRNGFQTLEMGSQKKALLQTLGRWNKFAHGPFQRTAQMSKVSLHLLLITAGSSLILQPQLKPLRNLTEAKTEFVWRGQCQAFW